MDIIGRIYEALDDEEVFEMLPYIVSETIGSRSCTFQIFSKDFDLEIMRHHYFQKEMDQFYRENGLHVHDLWAKTMLQAGVGRANLHSEFIKTAEFCKSFFYNEFIRRFGDDSAHCLGFGSETPDGGLVVMGLHRARSDHDFTEEQRSKLETLRPHITRVAVLRKKLAEATTASVGALAAVDCLEDAYLVLSPDRRISFANIAAEALLQQNDLLQTSEGKLYLHRIQDDQRFARALSDTNSNRLAGKMSFLARDKSGLSWRFTLAPKTFEGKTLVLVWIDRCMPAASAPQAMQQIYGLTQAELPILMAVSQGLSAGEISDQHGISIATVRSHIQHIYQKTGVNKASQLAQLVASLPRVK